MKPQQLFTLVLSAMVLISLTVVSWAQSPKPNVVLMLSDNVGYGDIGALQGGAIRGVPTPNIDRLAGGGWYPSAVVPEKYSR